MCFRYLYVYSRYIDLLSVIKSQYARTTCPEGLAKSMLLRDEFSNIPCGSVKEIWTGYISGDSLNDCDCYTVLSDTLADNTSLGMIVPLSGCA